jgi:hypothetical protein
MKFKLFILLFATSSVFCHAQTKAPQPIFQIGMGKARIFFPDFRRVDSARIEMSDYSKSTYVIKGFTVTVLSDSTKTYKVVKNSGAKLNDEVKQMFLALKSYDTILIDDIIVLNALGRIVPLDTKIYKVL